MNLTFTRRDKSIGSYVRVVFLRDCQPTPLIRYLVDSTNFQLLDIRTRSAYPSLRLHVRLVTIDRKRLTLSRSY